MKYRTTRFGELEFPDEVVMTFPEGVLGFPQDVQFILLEHDAEGSPFKWLQSLDNPDLAFIILDPLSVDPRYNFEIDRDTERVIGTAQAAQCAVMSIVNVPHDRPIQMTANMKAPLVVNVETRLGRQVILGTQAFSINAPVFPHLLEDERADEDESYLQQKAAS